MCGIGAVVLRPNLTKKQLDSVKWKMKILFAYNNTRGGDGCGIYINEQIYKGFGENSSSLIFMSNFDFPDIIQPLKNEGSSIIIHCRKSTMGANVEKNCHPFLIKTSENSDNDIVIVHNGTIKNWTFLCNKYKVNHQKILIDSEGMGNLIASQGINVLKEYEGEATFIWTKPSEPNKTYVFHGAGYKTKEGKEKKELYEERPLFCLETPEGIYFSSLENSLSAINTNKKEKIISVRHNAVFEVVDGVFTDNIVEIDRKTTNIDAISTSIVRTTTVDNTRARYSWGSYSDDCGEYEDCYGNTCYPSRNSQNNTKRIDSLSKKDDKSTIDIFLELPPTGHPDKIYFFKGLYRHSNGDVLDGSYLLNARGYITSDIKNSTLCIFDHGRLSNVDHPHYDFLKKTWVLYSTKAEYAHVINRTPTMIFTPKWSCRSYKIVAGECIEIKTSHKNDIIFEKKDETGLLEQRKTSDKYGISVFDIYLSDYTNFDKALNDDEQQACLMYLKKEFFSDWTPSEQIHNRLSYLIHTGVSDKKTIRESLDDKLGLLDIYLLATIKVREKNTATNDLPFNDIEDSSNSSISEALDKKEDYSLAEENSDNFSKVCDILDSVELLEEYNELIESDTDPVVGSLFTWVKDKVREFKDTFSYLINIKKEFID